jgi:Flp pilus assembly protein TadD
MMKRHTSTGNAYLLMGDYMAAIRDLSEVIRLNPVDNEAYFDRGCAYKGIGDEGSAFKDIERAAQLGNRIAHEALNNTSFKDKRR